MRKGGGGMNLELLVEQAKECEKHTDCGSCPYGNSKKCEVYNFTYITDKVETTAQFAISHIAPLLRKVKRLQARLDKYDKYMEGE